MPHALEREEVSDERGSEPASGGAPNGDSDASGVKQALHEGGTMIGYAPRHRRPHAKGFVGLAVGLFLGIAMLAQVAFAGNPHFVTADASRSDNTLTVSFKEAGLGNEAQVHVVLSATALCINNGGKHPKAVNKESVSSAGDFPVQNGKAEGTLSLTATFQPDCSPPMTVQFTDVSLVDETSGARANIPGTF
jgi:hypothetical protein